MQARRRERTNRQRPLPSGRVYDEKSEKTKRDKLVDCRRGRERENGKITHMCIYAKAEADIRWKQGGKGWLTMDSRGWQWGDGRTVGHCDGTTVHKSVA